MNRIRFSRGFRQGTAFYPERCRRAAVPYRSENSGVSTPEVTCTVRTPYRGGRAANLLFATCLIASSLPLAQVVKAQSQPPTHAKVLGQRLKCMCGGCGDTASSCNHTGGAFSGPCDTAKGMLKEASDRISAGSSDDLVLQSFVQEYGPTVLIEPPKAGFNLLAWIMPIVMPILALFAVWIVVRRWRHRAILAPAGSPPISADLLARAHREAERGSDE
jgi:cytochrome c-type biogenesis protein CcmH/NrfF